MASGEGEAMARVWEIRSANEPNFPSAAGFGPLLLGECKERVSVRDSVENGAKTLVCIFQRNVSASCFNRWFCALTLPRFTYTLVPVTCRMLTPERYELILGANSGIIKGLDTELAAVRERQGRDARAAEEGLKAMREEYDRVVALLVGQLSELQFRDAKRLCGSSSHS